VTYLLPHVNRKSHHLILKNRFAERSLSSVHRVIRRRILKWVQVPVKISIKISKNWGEI